MTDSPSLIRQAFVFAAGRGLRFRPYSRFLPKPMFPVEGETLVARNVGQLDRAFPGLERITVLVADAAGPIPAALASLPCAAKLAFVQVTEANIGAGLLGGFAQIASQVTADELFLAILGDEFHGGADHARFAAYLAGPGGDAAAVCAIKRMKTPDEYFKNYAVILEEGSEDRIGRVVEKPDRVLSDYFGLGVFAVRGHLCAMAAQVVANGPKAQLIDLLNRLPAEGKGPLKGFAFEDIYVNINAPSDIYDCLRQVRERAAPTVDVIIPAWNEAESIAYVVRDFLPACRKVIVMDNVSPDGTARVAAEAGAEVHSEKLAGYGDAIKKGLDRSDADILVIVEADGTFRAKDLPKLLAYMNDADAVIGSRTYWQYIEYGANMDLVQRMANVAYGLIITGLWWNRKSRFTDVGCSYRALWRSSYRKIEPRLSAKGPAFAPELVIELLESWCRVIEVPVPYHSRVLGSSKFSGNFRTLARTATKMMALILRKRIRGWLGNLWFLVTEGRR